MFENIVQFLHCSVHFLTSFCNLIDKNLLKFMLSNSSKSRMSHKYAIGWQRCTETDVAKGQTAQLRLCVRKCCTYLLMYECMCEWLYAMEYVRSRVDKGDLTRDIHGIPSDFN